MAFLQLDTLWVSDVADGIAAVVLDVPGDKTNVVSSRLLENLNTALDRIEKERRFRLLMIRSGKENHFASGPGIEDLARINTPEDFTRFARRGQEILQRLESFAIPSVAMIAGPCLGAGLELALACDYRVIVHGAPARLGFSLADLGLLPAWGGTQRLPRRVGFERGLLMLLRERQLSAATALDWGLVDAVVENGEQLPDALDDPGKRPHGFLPLRTWRQWFFERFRWGRWLIAHGMELLLRRRLPDDLPAPWEILQAVRQGLDHGRLAGLEYERTALARIGQSEAFRNLLRLQQSIAGRAEGLSQRTGTPTSPPMNDIGVVGAGTRGLQILVLALGHGCRVVVREANETSLGRAMYQLLTLLMPAAQSRGMKPQQLQDKLAGIKGTTAWMGFSELDIVLDTTGTDAQERQAIFRALDQETRPDALLVTTSLRPALAELRAGMVHPQRLARMHFVFPVKRGSLAEVAGLPNLAMDLAERLSAWASELGCVPVVVQDRPGLLVQRIWLAALQEAILLLREGMAVKRVDEALRRFGMTAGPLEQADLVGLDRLELLAAELEMILPARFFQDEILAQMIDRGWHGQRSRLGFYQYGGRRLKPNAQLPALLRELRDLDAPPVPLLSSKEQLTRCRERVVLRTVNEAAWCLEEGLVDSAETLDLALAVAGWAPHRGGPLYYARQVGIAGIVNGLETLARECGLRFAPCPALQSIGSRG